MARQVLSSYRRDDFADPDSFLVQLGMVLERYDDDVITAVTSPVTGIQRKQFKHQGPPTIADVVDACNGEVERLHTIKRYSEMGQFRRSPRAAQHRANVFVPPEAPQYAAMVDKARTGDPQEWRRDDQRAGIWVALGWLTDDESAKSTGFRPFTREELESIYRRNEGAEAAE